LARAYLLLGVLEAAAAMRYSSSCSTRPDGNTAPNSPGRSAVPAATSACLATIVVMQMMNVFLCRHPLKSSRRSALRQSLLLLGLVAELG